MALSIIQIPPQETVTLTGTQTEDSPLPINWKPIAPIVVKQSSDISSWFKFRFILRIYANAVVDANILATLRQSPNMFSTTTNSNAIFDLRSIVNTQLQATFKNSNATSKEIHKIGVNAPATLFSLNDNTIRTIVVKATYEYATTSESAPIEQTSSPVTLSMYFSLSSFGTFEYSSITNPLVSYYNGSSITSLAFSDLTETFNDTRHQNKEIGGGAILNGRINYLNSLTDYHILGFMNKSGWGSDITKMIVTYFDKDGLQLSTTTISQNATNGGQVPTSATIDSEFLLFAGVGTGNLENQTIDTDANPSDSANVGWSYYTIVFKNSAFAFKSVTYYFVKDFVGNENCKGANIVRLGWSNSVGGWDYFNFNAGQTQTIASDRMNYSELIGSESLDSGNSFDYQNWQGGTRTYNTTSKLKSTLTTQFITQEESVFLESLFQSNNVMIIESGSVVPVSQSVIISNKSFVMKEKGKDRLQIQYTFEIEYSNSLNNNN